MNKCKRFCLILAVIMLAISLAGCAQQSDEDILATVDGTPVYRWQFDVYMRNQLSVYQQYTGTDLTSAGYENALQTYRENRLEDLIGEAALKNEAKARGLYDLTDEEEAEIDQLYVDYCDESISTLMAQSGGTDDAARRRAEEDFEKFLDENSLTPERIRQIMLDDFVLKKLTAVLSEQVEITDEELQAEYDKQVADQQKALEEDPYAIEKGTYTPIIVMPEGYIRVKRILIPFTDDDQIKMARVEADMEAAMSELMQQAADSLAYQTKMNALEKASDDYSKVRDVALKNIREKSEEILNKAKAVKTVEEFIALAETHTGDYRVSDYYVCEGSSEAGNFDPEFAAAAYAMRGVNQAGDISELVETMDGYCIIYYEGEMEPGVRSLEEVKEDLRTQMENVRTAEQSRDWRTQYGTAADEAGLVERHLDLLQK